MDTASWFEAAETGNITFVQNNINAFKTSRNERRDTALMIAVGALQNHLLPLLIQAEYGLKNTHGQTALVIGVLAENLEAVQLLAPLESGSLTSTGKTALVVAFSKGFKDMVEILFPWESSYQYKGMNPEEVASDKSDQNYRECLAIARDFRTQKLWPVIDVLSKRINQIEYELYGVKQVITEEKIEVKQPKKTKQQIEPDIVNSEISILKNKMVTLEANILQIRNRPKPVQTIGNKVAFLEEKTGEITDLLNNVVDNIKDFHQAMKIVQKVIADISVEVLKIKKEK